MKTCNTCKAVNPGDTWNFCLNDGTALIDSDDEPTITFVAVQSDPWRLTAEDERRIQSCLDGLYKMPGFEELQYDARFERLVQRYKEKGGEFCLSFFRRLLGRLQLSGGTKKVHDDLIQAISKTNWHEGDNFLRTHGYI